MANKNRQTPHANQKWENNLTTHLLLYSARYILRSGEQEILRYIQLNLKKLNITHVMYVGFATVAQKEDQRDLFYWFFEYQNWGWISYFSGNIFPKLTSPYAILSRPNLCSKTLSSNVSELKDSVYNIRR